MKIAWKAREVFAAFRSRNGSKLANVSPERPTSTEYNQVLGEDAGSPPGKGFGKKTARTTFSFTPNIRKMIFWSAETRRQTRDENDGKVLAPSFLPSHLLRTSSYMNFFRIQCNFILYKYTHLFFSFSLYIYFIYLFFCILIFFKFFFRVPECSGMFRNVPCS